jgi:uncharacterized protein (TIGR00369 family)
MVIRELPGSAAMAALKLAMDAEEVTRFVAGVYPASTDFGWTIQSLEPGACTVRMRVGQNDIRPGGTVSGPTMFALADVTAYLIVLAHVGPRELAVTTSASIHFLSRPPFGDLIASGRLLKLGRRLAVADMHIDSAVSGDLVAQATATYALPPA